MLVRKPNEKRLSGRPICKWEVTIKLDLREVGYVAGDSIDLAQDRDQLRAYVRVVMNLWVP